MHVEKTGHGPDLVLVHGWAMHGGIFAPLTDALRERYTLHLVDLPGHGRSAERDGRLELHDTVQRLADELPTAIWIGWSLGGLVAMEAAYQRPDAVHAIALIAASPRFVVAPDWPHGVEHSVFEEFGRDLARDYKATLDRFLALECHGSDCARAELRTLRAHVFDHGEPAPHVLADGLKILDETDLRATLQHVRVPALWIAGARDRLVPPAAMEWSAQQMPHARYASINGGGHAPFIGHPDRVLAELEPFLAQVSA